ncbi:unnamed protein product [Phytophthora fragariaefolia]|uniref:Unnamed protein product n=1 Tax=Phytophthora fragariaefolia TaxID=1490495 RepID=A0A9W6XZS3_9STRA|nr:unnamed protein product [Phytophthora fragariaefolia]
MSYAGSRMTTFAADASGLHIGIAECVKRNYRPLHIIGDNSVLVNQHRRRKPPKAQHLRNLYWKCRRKLACTDVHAWHVRQRGENMMVDQLANMAIETGRSTQVQLEGHPDIARRYERALCHMKEDITDWMVSMEDTTQVDFVADNQ